MFKVIWPWGLLGGVALVLGVYFLFITVPSPAQNSASAPPPKVIMIGSDVVESMQKAAAQINIVLSDECIASIKALVESRGFSQGAVVQMRGVMIRDAGGRDTWVCN